MRCSTAALLSVFMTNWFTAHLMHHTVGRASQHLPNGWQVNTLHFWLGNNLDSGAFRGAQAQWDRITVPMLTVGNWTGMALHLRGNTEAFMRAASKHKKLRIQNGSHVHPFYTEEGRQDQIRFFDYWLKGIDNGVMDEPPVKLAIRKGRDEIEWRYENEWPLARTRWQKLYFDLSPPAAGMPANAAGLVSTNPDEMHSRTYDATSLGSMGSTSAASSQVMGGGIKPGMGISLETPPLPQDVEVTGPLAASFWVSSSTEDMDLFLTLRNFDADGNEVLETGQQGTPVPVAKGWLRVSHRELDPELTLPYRPVPQAHAASVSDARRDREGRCRNLADLDGVQAWPPHPARRPAARRRRQPVLHALSRRLQHRHQHDLRRRRTRVLSAAACHSGSVKHLDAMKSAITPRIGLSLPLPFPGGEGRRRANARRRGGVILLAKKFTPPRSLRSRPSPSKGGWASSLRRARIRSDRRMTSR